MLLALAINFLITDGLFKGLLVNYAHIFRLRPWATHSDTIFPLENYYFNSSFPSGHVSATLTILTVLIYYYRKYWGWALLFALLLAFSRIHNGMHYPTDVLGGAILGMGYGLIAIKLAGKICKPAAKL